MILIVSFLFFFFVTHYRDFTDSSCKSWSLIKYHVYLINDLIVLINLQLWLYTAAYLRWESPGVVDSSRPSVAIHILIWKIFF